MGIEIERKFLVNGEGWREAPATLYTQGYLNRDKHRTVRVRIEGDQACLTVKGINVGPVRAEFEYPIPVADARQLITRKEAAERLAVSCRSIDLLARAGRLRKVILTGRKRGGRIPESSVNALSTLALRR